MGSTAASPIAAAGRISSRGLPMSDTTRPNPVPAAELPADNLQVQWLWEPYLAFGTVAVLDGDPGVGKSLLTLDLAARLTAGRPMPDGRPCPARAGGAV